MELNDKEWRQYFLGIIATRIREKFGKWERFSVQDLAIQLQGASFLSGKFSGTGSEAYMIIAWDILGCLRQRGEVIEVLNSPITSRPWMGGCFYKVPPQEVQA